MDERYHKTVCAIIISYNIGKDIYKCLNSIENQVNEVVIIDNASNSSTQNVLNNIENNTNVKVIYNGSNCGIAKALNQGVMYALSKGYKFVLTLDHDSIASSDMIFQMLSLYESFSEQYNIGIVAPMVYDINKKAYITNQIDDNQLYNEVYEPIQSGCLINIEVFQKVGFFNENLFIYYVDTEFCYKLQKHKYKILMCKYAKLLHEEGKKERRKIFFVTKYYNNYNSSAVYYRARNNIYMLKNYNKFFTSKDRLIKDFLLITLFDRNKLTKLRYFFKGILDGVNNKYGSL